MKGAENGYQAYNVCDYCRFDKKKDAIVLNYLSLYL